jgi:hypothetical protein
MLFSETEIGEIRCKPPDWKFPRLHFRMFVILAGLNLMWLRKEAPSLAQIKRQSDHCSVKMIVVSDVSLLI